ncbi:hypothetical protein OOJ09_07210 [Mesorhizobium qingshengii]|uniref:Uncharacterized protein n=1 Tax=Mesorhizobium qingshengii TaxID=1165689 RepID=A0ABT4QR00_9HYPH|nr:hypothetical protein [Mesorhizobium qingshengii]MCZ8543961.1 hypothetical protein [Mesorhizobium qingshengii]
MIYKPRNVDFVSFSSRRGQFDTSPWRWRHEAPRRAPLTPHRSGVTIGQIEAGGDRECAETLCPAGGSGVAGHEVVHRRSQLPNVDKNTILNAEHMESHSNSPDFFSRNLLNWWLA